MEITKELEAFQISIYCNIISSLLKKHVSLSVFKTTVFSYLLKKENALAKSYFPHVKIDAVNRYLSLLSGDFQGFANSLEFIIKAIDILVCNGLIRKTSNGLLEKTDKLDIDSNIFNESAFAEQVIEKSKKISEKQFIREVLYNV